MIAKLSDDAERRIAEIVKKYPQKESAAMPALWIAQEELGVLDSRAVEWVADRVGLPLVQVQELVTFYTMYKSKPVGKYNIQICRTLSCALLGAKSLGQCLKDKLGVNPGEVTDDGMFSWEQVECLGSCGTAPMCEINDTYFENLTAEKLDALIERIRKEKPDLSHSMKKDKLGEGLKGCPKSEVI